MTTSSAARLTNALTGETIRHNENVLAKLDQAIPATTLETLKRAFELDAHTRGPEIHPRVIAIDGPHAIAAITNITVRIVADDAAWTQHDLINKEAAQAQTIEDWRQWTAIGPQARHINIEIEVNDGASISLDTDFAIIPGWGSTVKNASIAVTRSCTLNEDQLSKMLDMAFVEGDLQRRNLASRSIDEDIRTEHAETAQVRAARVLSTTVRESDARALSILANAVLLGAITGSKDNDDTSYTTVIRAPHKTKNISVEVDGPPVEDGTFAAFAVSAEQPGSKCKRNT